MDTVQNPTAKKLGDVFVCKEPFFSLQRGAASAIFVWPVRDWGGHHSHARGLGMAVVASAKHIWTHQHSQGEGKRDTGHRLQRWKWDVGVVVFSESWF